MTDPTVQRGAGFPVSVYRIYSEWVRAGGRGGRSVYVAIGDAWRAGAREEAECRTEGRAPAALEVMDVVDGFGQFPELREHDSAHFAGVAAGIFMAGEPLRRRLAVAWRIVQPAWWGRVSDRLR